MSRRAPGEGYPFRRERTLSDGTVRVDYGMRLSLGYDAAGRRVRKIVYGNTMGKTREKAERLKVDAARGQPINTKTVTVAHFLEDWHRHGVENVGSEPSTARDYRSIIDNYLSPAVGRHRVDKLAPRQVQAFLDELAVTGRSPWVIRNVRAALRAAMGVAMKWQLVTHNVVKLTQAPRLDVTEVSPLTPRGAQLFLTAVSDHRLGNLFTVTTALGLRQSEALGLRWEDVDLDEHVLHVRQKIYRVAGGWHTGRPKSERSRRSIPFPAEIAAVFRRQRAQQLEDRLAAERWQDAELVFASVTGGPLVGTSVTKTMQRLMREAGLEPKRFHDLRHTAATLMLVMGVPLEVIQQTLGHASYTTTRDLYAHVLPQMQRQASDKIGAFLRGEA